jgi:hypothetical protein
VTIHGVNVLEVTDDPPTQRVRLWDCRVTWRDLNPEKGVFDFTRLDEFVSKWPKALLVLAGTPEWAAINPSLKSAPWVGPGSASPPKDLGDWDDFVTAVATRYKGRLNYQIWNEPQSKFFWEGTASFGVLAEMTARAYKIIKKTDPHAIVVAAPVLPRTSSGGMVRGSKWWNALKVEGWPCDVLSYHSYPEPGRGPEQFKWQTQQVRTYAVILHAPKKPLWCTEVNYNLMHGKIADISVRPFMKGTERVALAQDVKRVYWYAWNHGDPRVLGIPFTPTSVGSVVLGQLQV